MRMLPAVVVSSVVSSVLFSVTAALAPAALAAAPAADHPILGIWRLTLPDGSCSEIYRFRGDGTTLVTSAAEVTESEFTIPPKPSAKGFYKLDNKLVKDNGKADCGGNIARPGNRVTQFIQFDASGSVFIMCADETLDACIGPFRRMHGQET